ncbi:hypothetical protein BVC80_1419g13 [Macleaya cordata]|uniref:Uncharacterized protein n=1 Tax=Macleaya cordata TaxID=56857 RepID=A0A200Q5N0_MACCD|nr:hypothetical protein BVC80_1419g13 [Macleaya cordata]
MCQAPSYVISEISFIDLRGDLTPQSPQKRKLCYKQLLIYLVKNSTLRSYLCGLAHPHGDFAIPTSDYPTASGGATLRPRGDMVLPDKITRKGTRSPRRLIKIATSDGRWQGNWTCDYIFSLEQLQLADLAEDDQKDAEISITLNVQKHAGFGFSVEGRIITSFTRKCSNCSSSYCREINAPFDVWLLSSSRENRSSQLPEIGGDDPSVIYVKPGCEADLDSLIQDTIRLTTSVKRGTRWVDPKLNGSKTGRSEMDLKLIGSKKGGPGTAKNGSGTSSVLDILVPIDTLRARRRARTLVRKLNQDCNILGERRPLLMGGGLDFWS